MDNKNNRPRSLEDACDNAIKRTLAYCAIFNYPVSYIQLSTFLISGKSFNDNIFNNALKRLLKKQHIRIKNGRYYIPSIKPVSWDTRHNNSKNLLQENSWTFKLLEKIPWISLIAVTGSVAANNASKEDDIDIFIIAKKDRLWLVRGFTALILKVVKKYAVGNKNQNKLCCNLFIDETALSWPVENQSIYVAREIIGMVPIIQRDNMYFRYIKANSWVFKYYKNFVVDFTDIEDKVLAKSKIVDGLENLARYLQLKYMKDKKTSEITKSSFIHFNKNDHSKQILKDYELLSQRI